MNKHVLLVMKWLADKNSVTIEELEKNKHDAAIAAKNAYNVAYDDAAYSYAFDGSAAEWAAVYAAVYADAAYQDDDAAAAWVDRYFKITGEDKNEYF